MRCCSRVLVIYLASSFYCFCINGGNGTGNCQERHCACSLRIEQGRRILSHFFADIKHTSWVLTLFLRGKFPFPVPRIEYNKVALKSVLALLKVLCPLTTYFLPLPVGRQTLKAITVQHSPPLPRARPGHPVSGKLQETAKLRAHIVQDVASGRVT